MLLLAQGGIGMGSGRGFALPLLAQGGLGCVGGVGGVL